MYTLEKMSITVRDLMDLPGLGLKVIAGEAGLDRAIRWVHTSELSDPTPWLSGGELLLTTGMALTGSASLQRAYIRRLVSRDIAGLGFGVGFGFDEVPATIVRAAEREGFPLLEVPYPVPFIAITEAVSQRLTADRLRDAQMSVEVHERLAMLVSDGAGPADVLEEATALTGGWAILFDTKGDVLARSPGDVPDPQQIFRSIPSGLLDRKGASTATDTGPQGSRMAMAVTVGKRQAGVLVFGKGDRIGERDRMVVHHALTVLGLLLASRRAVIDAERRVAGDILSDAFAGRLRGPDLDRKMELLGFQPAAPLIAVIVDVPAVNDAARLEDLVWTVDSMLGSRCGSVRTTLMGDRIAALVTHDEPGALVKILVAALDDISRLEGAGEMRAGVGEKVGRRDVRHSYLSALFALKATRATTKVASPSDLGSYAFLLGAQSPSVLEGYVRSVLGPLIERDQDRSSDLVESVRAYVENGGRWEPGAESLGIHRHTLRYRIHQVEELLGRNLSSPQDQMEVWLALKAMDVLAE